MAFSMCNAPATFQRSGNTVLAGVANCNAHLDDLIVYSFSWAEHMQTLTEVFHRLLSAYLTLNLTKCEFGKGTVTYLGRRVGLGQVRPIEAKILAITDFPKVDFQWTPDCQHALYHAPVLATLNFSPFEAGRQRL